MRILKGLLTAADVTELLAADDMGLVPDPWRQTGMICETIINYGPRPREVPARWHDFVPMVREQDDMTTLYQRRKAAHGKAT